jgi:hypothetical protein
MSDFLLGMLVMWFTYPLLSVTREVMADKFVSVTMNNKTTSEDVTKSPTMGFKLSGK